ncbi:YybH family protein [Leptolyngbya ohadii]|uniref:YybH family protein n=1 Tax=Leptolyngbya ohadii TaxID=1962290 RepID=UPI000B59C845|nr:nuclear transport factor 2 family protein [Leptolyngbya ohadii]
MIVDRPEKMNFVLDSLFNSGDVEAVISLYEPGAKLILDSGQEIVGLHAIREVYEDWLTLNGKMQSRTLYCTHLADIALLRTAWTISGTGSNGCSVEFHGDAIEVIRRQLNGSWRYAIDHISGAASVISS